VIEPDVDFQWLAVEDVAREEGHNKAKAVFRLFGRKLKAMGFEKLVPEEVVREGIKAEEITKLIEEDEDMGLLVLGASRTRQAQGRWSRPCRRQACRHLSGADHRCAGPSQHRRNFGAGLKGQVRPKFERDSGLIGVGIILAPKNAQISEGLRYAANRFGARSRGMQPASLRGRA
jgi:hypothetical protein